MNIPFRYCVCRRGVGVHLKSKVDGHLKYNE